MACRCRYSRSSSSPIANSAPRSVANTDSSSSGHSMAVSAARSVSISSRSWKARPPTSRCRMPRASRASTYARVTSRPVAHETPEQQADVARPRSGTGIAAAPLGHRPSAVADQPVDEGADGVRAAMPRSPCPRRSASRTARAPAARRATARPVAIPAATARAARSPAWSVSASPVIIGRSVERLLPHASVGVIEDGALNRLLHLVERCLLSRARCGIAMASRASRRRRGLLPDRARSRITGSSQWSGTSASVSIASTCTLPPDGRG